MRVIRDRSKLHRRLWFPGRPPAEGPNPPIHPLDRGRGDEAGKENGLKKKLGAIIAAVALVALASPSSADDEMQRFEAGAVYWMGIQIAPLRARRAARDVPALRHGRHRQGAREPDSLTRRASDRSTRGPSTRACEGATTT